MIKSGRALVALGIVAIMLISGIGLYAMNQNGEETNYPHIPLAEDYMLFVDAPADEGDMMMIASISMLAVHSEGTGKEYHPLFILDENGLLDDHELWTLRHLGVRGSGGNLTKYVFSNHAGGIEGQLNTAGIPGNVVHINLTREDVNYFMRTKINRHGDGAGGFKGEIKVSSYKEALWVSSLAAVENKVITTGEKGTFSSQERVWAGLAEKGIRADYVLAANPEDYKGEDVFYSIFDGVNTSYHIPSLSAVAAEVAAYRQAYVVTDIPPVEEIEIPHDYKPMFPDPEHPESADPNDPDNDMYLNNLKAYGYYEAFKLLNKEYGPVSHIALVGSAEAVPQFELYDYSGSEPEYTSSDVAFGFLNDKDLYTMTSAVGRLVNFNVQGMSNQIVRTFAYDRISQTVDAENYLEPVSWRTHSSSWNGFEVADQRLQNSPGVYFVEDSNDEGFDATYWSTVSAGGGYSGDGGVTWGAEIAPELEASGLVAYRGHGSWHASFYQWGYYLIRELNTYGLGDEAHARLEGTYARTRFLPPQTACVVSCENAKIHGVNFHGEPIEMDRDFATSYLYAGAIGLVAATEVSYSNVGQDIESGSGAATGQYDWDINDLWYAGFWDNTLDGKYANGTHYEEETSGAEAVMWTENRYIQHLRDEFDGKTCSPFFKPPDGMKRARQGYEDEGGMHWKEVSMFAFYGEPMFKYYQARPGENDWNRWHNS